MAVGLTNSHGQRQFIERLTETILWCQSEGSARQPRTSLRNFKPDVVDLLSQQTQVFSVCLARSRHPSLSGKRTLSSITGLCGGRLLAYFPENDLADGCAERVSDGFFDVDNIPPYDTWVWMVRNTRTRKYADHEQPEEEANYLVAWVPPDFIPLASCGVDANPEGCILWLDTMNDEFVQSLRRMGFFQQLNRL